MARLGQGIALIGSPGVAPDPSLFDKNLYYLTGLTSKKSLLLLAPRGIRVQRWETEHGPEVGRGRLVEEVLFVEERTEEQKVFYGEGMGTDAIQRASGVERVLPLSQLNQELHENLVHEQILWANLPTCPRLDKPLTPDLVMYNRIRERFLWLQIRNIAPLIHDMRRIKEPYEIECLRQAFQIQTEIYEKIMHTLKPGCNESLGEAIWHYESKARYNPQIVTCEALDHAEAHITVAAGGNAAILHYSDNNQEIQDGDLVLIDGGIDYKGYSSDISRTFPANGRFTPRQRELYSIVLEAQKLAISTMRPGSTARDAHRAVFEHFEKRNLSRYGLGWSGHPVGLNIHDANGDEDKPFEPGVVIVIEPLLAIPEQGIGIRIEDGILITEAGVEMMPGPPKEIADVEALCQNA
jgi:Xaa-Pro aminopeptidase